MKLRLVGDRLSLEMFRLAGVVGESPETAEAIEAAIEKYLIEPEVGVLLVSSSRAAQLGDRFRKYIERRRLPLVLRIPDREDRGGEAGLLRDYLQRTLGIRL